MSNYLEQYVGKYRVLLPIDQKTNDFPRDPNGKIDTDDYYIPCKKSGRYVAEITHYKDDVLTALVFTPISPDKYKPIKLLKNEGVPVFDVTEGTGEFFFRFYAKDMDIVAKLLGAITQGKKIKPTSIKNLPKSDYKIPAKDLDDYRVIIADISKADSLRIAEITRSFLVENCEKSQGEGIDKELKQHKMSRQQKEYIYMMGLWDEYLDYLKEKLNGI